MILEEKFINQDKENLLKAIEGIENEKIIKIIKYFVEGCLMRSRD